MTLPTTGFAPGEVTFSKHFLIQTLNKGFTKEQIHTAIYRPEKITHVHRYPGQLRYIGGGIAVVMNGKVAVTAYLDGVRTPLRPDQLRDPLARTSQRALPLDIHDTRVRV